jgi:hypothetical protein
MVNKGGKMVIWQDIAVPIIEKQVHVRAIKGAKARRRFSFIKTFGDIPVAIINSVTGKIEPVVNNRGRAYAARRRNAYRGDAYRNRNVKD